MMMELTLAHCHANPCAILAERDASGVPSVVSLACEPPPVPNSHCQPRGLISSHCNMPKGAGGAAKAAKKASSGSGRKRSASVSSAASSVSNRSCKATKLATITEGSADEEDLSQRGQPSAPSSLTLTTQPSLFWSPYSPWDRTCPSVAVRYPYLYGSMIDFAARKTYFIRDRTAHGRRRSVGPSVGRSNA